MTRTERAWQLIVKGWPEVSAIDAFKSVDLFETEAAKHEEPKAEGEVWYAVCWKSSNVEGKLCLSSIFEMTEAERFLKDLIEIDPSREHFLVEIRRVK